MSKVVEVYRGYRLRLRRKWRIICEETMLVEVEVDKGLTDDSWGHGKELLEDLRA